MRTQEQKLKSTMFAAYMSVHKDKTGFEDWYWKRMEMLVDHYLFEIEKNSEIVKHTTNI